MKLLMQSPPTDPRTMPAIRMKAQKKKKSVTMEDQRGFCLFIFVEIYVWEGVFFSVLQTQDFFSGNTFLTLRQVSFAKCIFFLLFLILSCCVPLLNGIKNRGENLKKNKIKWGDKGKGFLCF